MTWRVVCHHCRGSGEVLRFRQVRSSDPPADPCPECGGVGDVPQGCAYCDDEATQEDPDGERVCEACAEGDGP